MSVMIIQLMNGGTPDDTGEIPMMLNEDNPKPAREQLDAGYQHGGGWRPMSKFTFNHITKNLRYPGDPPLKPLAEMTLRDEVVRVYAYGFVGIFQQDGTFEVARMD